MKYSFAIGIPTLNRADLLNPTLLKYFQDFPNVDIFIVDNGKQEINSRPKNFEIHSSVKNYGVAKSWNYLCERIYQNHDYALILNDDIYLGLDQDLVNDFAKGQCIDLVKCQNQFHLSSFILSRECFQEFKFDENFYPAYFEDRDFMRRLSLSNRQIMESAFLNPEIFINSATISIDGGDPEINKNFNKLGELYVNKWGGPPGLETFKTPFNAE